MTDRRARVDDRLGGREKRLSRYKQLVSKQRPDVPGWQETGNQQHTGNWSSVPPAQSAGVRTWYNRSAVLSLQGMDVGRRGRARGEGRGRGPKKGGILQSGTVQRERRRRRSRFQGRRRQKIIIKFEKIPRFSERRVEGARRRGGRADVGCTSSAEVM